MGWTKASSILAPAPPSRHHPPPPHHLSAVLLPPLPLLPQIAETAAPIGRLDELSAAVLQVVVTAALAGLCALLYRNYRKPVYAWWAGAWTLYLVRLGAILTFLGSGDWIWLYWHQVLTGWTALGVLATAVVFANGGGFRWWFGLAAVFPPLWSYLAIYVLEHFVWAALPAVVFLSAATLATGVVFWRYASRVGSVGARVLAVAFLLWGLHHLDYPILRARGAWVPWGYYLDIIFALAVGAGILLLVADDLRAGVQALTTLSGELQQARPRARNALLDALLARPLTLPSVRGAALYRADLGHFEQGAGVCSDWAGRAPQPAEQQRLDAALVARRATMHDTWTAPDGDLRLPFAAVLPVSDADGPRGALVIVGEARTPFAALDESFLTALGQQVGSALATATLTDALAQRSAELERLSGQMLRQYEEQRQRLSRELHDETAQVLSALKMELGVIRRVVPLADQGRVDDALTLVDVGIRSIRAVTDELRPPLLEDLGLVPALRSLVDDVAGRSGLVTQFTVEDEARTRLAADAELALFRAVQEGIANVLRHAGASRLTVTLRHTPAAVDLTLEDDGRGFDPTAIREGAMGLTGMRERVAALGGRLSVTATGGRGTTLRITLPGEASA
jgi:signal transduction histidine kinase